MFQSLFSNMQPVVKNLLIINVLFFFATFVFERQGIDLGSYLGLYYIDSPKFQPYQLATHFFMHASVGHIFFNMFALVMFGNLLERVWGAKRFLFFYMATALGAALLYQIVQGIEVFNETQSFFPNAKRINDLYTVRADGIYGPPEYIKSYLNLNIPVVGASGAVYGLLMAVALLFPNTEVLLYFAIPVKMKWLALGLGIIALYSGIQDNPGDSVAHFAHLGGMLFGFILIKIWQRNKSQFY